MSKKNIAYARQSLRQNDKESSTIGQFKAINAYAENNNTGIHHHIHDEGSGKSLFRNGIQQVIQLIKNEEVNMLIVWRLDRLARNTNDLLTLFEMAEEKSISIISLNDSITSYDSSMDKFKVQLLASVAQWQREIISENKTLGLQEKFKQGHIIGTEAPFGYQYKNKKFQLVTDEAYTIKAVFHMYLNGLGYKKISNKTAQTDRLINRSPAQIRNILTNPKCTGDYHSKYGVLKNKIPRIVSHEVYEKASSIRQGKQTHSNYSVPANLRRRIKCPYCSNTMTTFHDRHQKNSTPKYICATKMQRQYVDCPMHSISVRSLENLVFQQVINFLKSPDELSRLSDLIHEEVLRREKLNRRKQTSLKASNHALIDKLAAGNITSEEFQEQMNVDNKSSTTTTLSLIEVHSKLERFEQLMSEHKDLKNNIFQLVHQVTLKKTGDLQEVYLIGVKNNILKKSLKESIEHEFIRNE